ncbi:MAG: hypothetical protein Q7R66_21600 [Undibacterium sp.]|uniref:hypothetical protein n=1 Tax=Undibacterium sp. TaxID=1914977 RepID=UPI00271FA1F6|nr:hypothetical protein [Undibacterium sp.]MDO8654773.1 hypothetical protein [Undibacterium sp.]
MNLKDFFSKFVRAFRSQIRKSIRFIIFSVTIIALQFGTLNVANAQTTRADAEANLLSKIEKAVDTLKSVQTLIEDIENSGLLPNPELEKKLKDLKKNQSDLKKALKEAMKTLEASLLSGGQPSIDNRFLADFVTPGALTTLEFQFLDPITHLVVVGPSVASVHYETILDPGHPDIRIDLGISTDVVNHFALNFVISDIVQVIIATPLDAAGLPLFLRGVNDTDNIAAGIMVAIDNTNVIPVPATAFLVMSGLALIAIRRRLQITHCLS